MPNRTLEAIGRTIEVYRVGLDDSARVCRRLLVDRETARLADIFHYTGTANSSKNNWSSKSRSPLL